MSSSFFLRRALGAGLAFSSAAFGGGGITTFIFFGVATRRAFGATGAAASVTWTASVIGFS